MGIHLSTQRLDHLGIVAGVCHEIELIKQIDAQVGVSRRNVSVGEAVQAMVLNALGFTSRALYLTPEYFANKPVDVLIREGLTAADMNDDSLGRALDTLYEIGVSTPTTKRLMEFTSCEASEAISEASEAKRLMEFTSCEASEAISEASEAKRLMDGSEFTDAKGLRFASAASHALGVYGIDSRFYHLDSTSFSVEGAYATPSDDPQAVVITHGYSRDHRPDLKQVVVSLICTYQSSIPIWLEALSGNSSDKTSFPKTIKTYVEQMEMSCPFYKSFPSGCKTDKKMSETPYFIFLLL